MKRLRMFGAYTLWQNSDGSLCVADPRGYFIYPHADLIAALTIAAAPPKRAFAIVDLLASHDALLDYDTDRETDAVPEPTLPFDKGGWPPRPVDT